MSKPPPRDLAIEILRKEQCPAGVIRHCIAVADTAMEMFKTTNLEKKADPWLVEIGALLHDLGRARTNGIDHGVLGAEMARELGMDGKLVNIIANHVGAGIPAEEAEALGLPSKDYMPRTLEEKIVCYADKLTEGGGKMSYKRARQQLVKQLGLTHPAVNRLAKLHEEMLDLGIKDGEPRSVGKILPNKNQRICSGIEQ